MSVAVPVPASEAGEKLAVAPLGSPDAESAMEPLRLFAVAVTWYVTELPATTDAEDGDTFRLKSEDVTWGTIWIPLTGAR